MRKRAKRAFLHLSKWLGLFQLARSLTRRGLRILCYHGYSLSDESAFRPRLFIQPETFHQRLKFLHDRRFPVLELGQALAQLRNGNPLNAAVVLTIDDGFYGVRSRALELLQKFSFPATVYVTTYYCAKQNPIFRLVIQYMFWKSDRKSLDWSGPEGSRQAAVSLADPAARDRWMWEFIRYGETQCEEPQRQALARMLGDHLQVDYDSIVRTRVLSLMGPEEIHELAGAGLDIQLHTHRHRFPLDPSGASQEIADNRAVLQPLVGKPLNHFCYPSGLWSTEHWPWLEAAGVSSATTCEPGLNYPDTPALGLKRFLDGQDVAPIEFEAELYGYTELLRRVRSRFIKQKQDTYPGAL